MADLATIKTPDVQSFIQSMSVYVVSFLDVHKAVLLYSVYMMQTDESFVIFAGRKFCKIVD